MTKRIPPYEAIDLEREQVQGTMGPMVLDFGTNWCGYCRSTRPLVAEILAEHPEIGYRAIEDGKGRRLGRSFRVKLWPTLIFVHDGQERARLVRPTSKSELERAVAEIL